MGDPVGDCGVGRTDCEDLVIGYADDDVNLGLGYGHRALRMSTMRQMWVIFFFVFQL